MARICVSSHHRSLAALAADREFLDLARRARRGGPFLIELRLDLYRDLSAESFARVVRKFGPRILAVAFRSPREGGGTPRASLEQRLAFLRQAIQLRAAFVDLELRDFLPLDSESAEGFRALRRAALRFGPSRPRLILSFHDFSGSPPLSELRRLRRAAEQLGADVVKLAVLPRDVLDTAPLARLMAERGRRKPLLALAMGEDGVWTRILGPRFPGAAPFTFARGESAPGTAPGQLGWRELLERYRFPEINPRTPVYGVIGDPIAHSLSPAMHNAALAACGLPGVYAPFRVRREPGLFVRRLAPLLGLRGISVTIPHKEAAAKAAARLDPLARRIGAANTLVRRKDGNWFAANTDARAAAATLEAALGGSGRLRGRPVLILGAGGAARAVAFGLRARGARVFIWNRTRARAERLARELKAAVANREELPGRDFAALVNTTPVGMHPLVNASPLRARELPRRGLVFDTVYVPRRTKLLRLAAARGLRTLEGLAMFIEQGAAQFRLFTRRAAPVRLMERTVRAALEERHTSRKRAER